MNKEIRQHDCVDADAADRLAVRAARAGDCPRVQAIASEAMRAFGIEPDFDGLDRELGTFGQANAASLIELVAELDGEIAGSLALSWKNEDPVNRVLKLSAFYVDSKFRGLGAGKLLLREAIALAQQHGACQIYLETWSTMTAAVHLYTSLGWRQDQQLAPETGAEWSYVLELTQEGGRERFAAA
jgi:putative acetyltransferase